MSKFFEHPFFDRDLAGPLNRAGGSPCPGISFLHRLVGHASCVSNTPCPGGKIFAEPQRRFRRLRTAGTVRAVPARGQKGGHQGFHPFESRFLLEWHGEILRTETIKERQRIFSSVGGGHWPPLSPPLRNARFPTATHTVYSPQARLIVPRNSLPRCRRRHLRIFLCEYALSDILSTLHSISPITHKKEPEAKASGSFRLCAYFLMISAMNTRSVSPVLSSA